MDFFEVFIAVSWLHASTPESVVVTVNKGPARRAEVEGATGGHRFSERWRTRAPEPSSRRLRKRRGRCTSDREKNEASGCLTTLGYVRPFLVGGQVMFMFGNCA